jgi:hypothetical protein
VTSRSTTSHARPRVMGVVAVTPSPQRLTAS